MIILYMLFVFFYMTIADIIWENDFSLVKYLVLLVIMPFELVAIYFGIIKCIILWRTDP